MSRSRSSVSPACSLLKPALLALALAFAFSGCATGTVSMLVPISTGEKVRVPIGKKGVEPTTLEGLAVEQAVFTLNEEKKLVYLFEVSETRHRAWQSVKIEDVSDNAPILLVEDTQPAVKNNRWRGASRPFGPGDPALHWIATITNSVRVYRVTVTFADGTSLTLLQGSMVPAPVKRAVRNAFGENY